MRGFSGFDFFVMVIRISKQGFLILWSSNHAFVRLVELKLNDLLSFIK